MATAIVCAYADDEQKEKGEINNNNEIIGRPEKGSTSTTMMHTKKHAKK